MNGAVLGKLLEAWSRTPAGREVLWVAACTASLEAIEWLARLLERASELRRKPD